MLSFLDSFESSVRANDRPFRYVISDVFKDKMSSSVITVSGKIEAESVQMDDRLLIMPNGDAVQVKCMSFE